MGRSYCSTFCLLASLFMTRLNMTRRSRESEQIPPYSEEACSTSTTENGKRTLSVLLLVLLCSCDVKSILASEQLGKFNKKHDLYLAHFDSKTDVDDLHSVAAVATMLADRRFAGVSYHAVAGAYGRQGGLYVPANELFTLAFGPHWSDAHADSGRALEEVSKLATSVLQSEGKVWISEAGQSDFTAALCRRLRTRLPDTELKCRVILVQHADWNEEVTTPAELAYVKKVATYNKIPDGNTVGNGTPGFRSDQIIDWQRHVTDARLRAIWEKAFDIANTYNGADDRYLNESIKRGGLDFSDVAETTWIFGFGDLLDANDFFQQFSTEKPRAAE